MNLPNPTQFFKSYLPKQDDTITLIDEDKEESTVKFKSESTAFGSGWKDFCTAHKLFEGDEALTKQIPPCRPTGIHEKIDHIRANTCGKKRAEEVQRNLDPKYPSIVRPLCSYHVGSGTNQLQHLPPSFCNLYLSNQDITFTLVDEDMGDCKVKFKYASRRLGYGWRRFSNAHELVVRDAMVFHLVKPAEFKVYIIRAYSLSGVDKDFGLRDSEAPAMQNNTCTPIRTHEKTELKCPSTVPFGTISVIISDS
ncbi:hypothetical protein GIB67_030575 [Kingdonia uniflora]|uniref:TF-B3 domain-containing protein n=1 Tax=Kingdonia uniflora TaxID=39325 RepID=A0A7J7PC81_9MAGN|nr:hypothetical protein GIB67_030575 [Kingdonia uniflora]